MSTQDAFRFCDLLASPDFSAKYPELMPQLTKATENDDPQEVADLAASKFGLRFTGDELKQAGIQVAASAAQIMPASPIITLMSGQEIMNTWGKLFDAWNKLDSGAKAQIQTQFRAEIRRTGGPIGRMMLGEQVTAQPTSGNTSQLPNDQLAGPGGVRMSPPVPTGVAEGLSGVELGGPPAGADIALKVVLQTIARQMRAQGKGTDEIRQVLMSTAGGSKWLDQKMEGKSITGIGLVDDVLKSTESVVVGTAQGFLDVAHKIVSGW